MLNELIYAIIQAATEFLPVSSSGHLALFSNIMDKPNLFLFTALHFSSLLAVVIFTRKEIAELVRFKKDRKMWIYLMIATIPAALIGFLFKDVIERTFSNLVFLAYAFLFTGCILFFTKFANSKKMLNYRNSLFIGLMQTLALFPGVSRSGMTISAGLFAGIDKEKAAKFSFLLIIPLILGAIVLEMDKFYFDSNILTAMIVCTVLSIFFLGLLTKIIQKDKFWMFSFYCWLVGILILVFIK